MTERSGRRSPSLHFGVLSLFPPPTLASSLQPEFPAHTNLESCVRGLWIWFPACDRNVPYIHAFCRLWVDKALLCLVLQLSGFPLSWCIVYCVSIHSRGVFGLFPIWSNYGKSCYKHLFMHLCVNIKFHFTGSVISESTSECMVDFIKIKPPYFFQKWF